MVVIANFVWVKAWEILVLAVMLLGTVAAVVLSCGNRRAARYRRLARALGNGNRSQRYADGIDACICEIPEREQGYLNDCFESGVHPARVFPRNVCGGSPSVFRIVALVWLALGVSAVAAVDAGYSYFEGEAAAAIRLTLVAVTAVSAIVSYAAGILRAARAQRVYDTFCAELDTALAELVEAEGVEEGAEEAEEETEPPAVCEGAEYMQVRIEEPVARQLEEQVAPTEDPFASDSGRESTVEPEEEAYDVRRDADETVEDELIEAAAPVQQWEAQLEEEDFVEESDEAADGADSEEESAEAGTASAEPEPESELSVEVAAICADVRELAEHGGSVKQHRETALRLQQMRLSDHTAAENKALHESVVLMIDLMRKLPG